MDEGNKMEMLSNRRLTLAHVCGSHISRGAISNRLLSALPHYLLLSFVLLNKGDMGTQPRLAYACLADGIGRGQALSQAPGGVTARDLTWTEPLLGASAVWHLFQSTSSPVLLLLFYSLGN